MDTIPKGQQQDAKVSAVSEISNASLLCSGVNEGRKINMKPLCLQATRWPLLTVTNYSQYG